MRSRQPFSAQVPASAMNMPRRTSSSHFRMSSCANRSPEGRSSRKHVCRCAQYCAPPQRQRDPPRGAAPIPRPPNHGSGARTRRSGEDECEYKPANVLAACPKKNSPRFASPRPKVPTPDVIDGRNRAPATCPSRRPSAPEARNLCSRAGLASRPPNRQLLPPVRLRLRTARIDVNTAVPTAFSKGGKESKGKETVTHHIRGRRRRAGRQYFMFGPLPTSSGIGGHAGQHCPSCWPAGDGAYERVPAPAPYPQSCRVLPLDVPPTTSLHEMNVLRRSNSTCMP